MRRHSTTGSAQSIGHIHQSRQRACSRCILCTSGAVGFGRIDDGKRPGSLGYGLSECDHMVGYPVMFGRCGGVVHHTQGERG